MIKSAFTVIIVLLSAFSSAASACAAGPEFDFSAVKKEGDIFERRAYDMDGDGKTETVALQAYNLQIFKEGGTEEIMSYSGLLTVFAPGSDKILWQAKIPPKTENNSRNLIDFIFGDFGLEPIEALGHITSTNSVELISPALQSDLRPVTYRLIGWDSDKKEFKLIKFGALKGALENPDTFKWGGYTDEEIQKCSWVGKVVNIKSPGFIEAEIWSYTRDVPMRGAAILKYVNDEFKVDGWIKKPEKIE